MRIIDIIWILLIFLNIEGDYLSYNSKLYSTAIYRQEKPTEYKIRNSVNINEYQCLLGLPYGYGELIGKEIYFLSSNDLYGPWLVVDVESNTDQGTMINHNLLADTNCKYMVHKKGELIVSFDWRKAAKEERERSRFLGDQKLFDRSIQWRADSLRDEVPVNIKEEMDKIYKSMEEFARQRYTVTTNKYEYQYSFTNYDLPGIEAEEFNIKEYESFLKRSKNSTMIKRNRLIRLDLEVGSDEDIRYLYFPGKAREAIIKGGIEKAIGKSVNYKISTLDLCYNDLPKFERQRVLGIEE